MQQNNNRKHSNHSRVQSKLYIKVLEWPGQSSALDEIDLKHDVHAGKSASTAGLNISTKEKNA